VIFLADDLGWADAAPGGGRLYETPQLERLAASGMRFEAAYAMPTCRATRAGLLTGRDPGARLRLVGGRPSAQPRVAEFDEPRWPMVRPQRRRALPGDEYTLAEALGDAGYATWLVGKWHLGRAAGLRPGDQGFQKAVAVGGGAPRSYFPPYGHPDLVDGPPDEYLTDRLTDEAIALLRDRPGAPFLLYLAHHAVHQPLQAPAHLVEKYRRKAADAAGQAGPGNPVMAAMIESLDTSLGRILDELELQDIADRTLVIFLSDNGGATATLDGRPITSNHPLRGGKGSLREGGIRVPLIVRWPAVTQPGSVSDVPVSYLDLYPTLLRAAGVAAGPGLALDGEDLPPLLEGRGRPRREALYLHFPVLEMASAVRRGHWKLLRLYGAAPDRRSRLELYDLAADPGESRDLASEQPERAAELDARLDAWLRETGALVPVPNPAWRGRAGAGERRAPALETR
jgi:arylsulfatase A-like enzyme